MFKNYFKTAWRTTIKNKAHSFINITGLSVGMAVAIMIGLWIYDELSFEKNNKNYDHIVQVLENSNIGDGLSTGSSLPMPLSAELRNKYGSDFKKIASTLTYDQNIVYADKAFTKTGCFAEADFVDIITLNILKGTQASLKDRSSVLISKSLAKIIFGNTDPINKIIKLNSSYAQKVRGVYKDFPKNTRFSNVDFIAPIDVLFASSAATNNWLSSAFQIYALLNTNSVPVKVSSKIKNALYENSHDASKPALFLFPMRQWHLYEFRNGEIVTGRMQFVWLFGIIGMFVLLLACINFMNLSTAQSEKRAKEVGIRKTIGSLRKQLIFQFFSESLLMVALAFVLSLLMVQFALPFFNEIADKEMAIFWRDVFFWLISFAFIIITALIAGSYPALFLSSFKPIKVLKGTFIAGRLSAIPRKALVVVQFTVSVTLIIATIVVFEQIQFAKNRPIGYNRNSLITILYNTSEIQNYTSFRNELLNTGAVTSVSASSSPTTGIWSSADNLNWKGKDPNRQEMFGTILIDPDYANVVEWKMKEGRNFSKELKTDSSSFIFNEAAIRQMNLKNPVGEIVQWHGRNWTIIGVVKDMVMTSPFDPIAPAVFLMDDKERSFNVINIKINPVMPVSEALSKIETVFKKFASDTPFNYKFADEEYALKFAEEERIGKLATVFAALAIFISCLGLFGMASFVAEQRTKEIGIRKVLGASVANLCGMLSKEFIVLVTISCFIAIPIAYYLSLEWLQNYAYRTKVSVWIFVATAIGSLLITLLTVSFQAIKAAIANPVKSLRME
jgi:ABC-type antimicrobial peptide transport system permease subunit